MFNKGTGKVLHGNCRLGKDTFHGVLHRGRNQAVPPLQGGSSLALPPSAPCAISLWWPGVWGVSGVWWRGGAPKRIQPRRSKQ
eukprot:gene15013-biopygen21682